MMDNSTTEKKIKNYINVLNVSYGMTIKNGKKKCEAWCKEHQSCNLDIIKYAVENNEKK